MAHHRTDSDCSNSSNASDIDRHPLFRDGNKAVYTGTSQVSIKLEKLDKIHQTLTNLIKELEETINELESMHRATTVASLTGAAVGTAAGIASIVGLCLAPFTFGASLVLTGAGAAAGVAGGVTGAASNIANIARQKTLRETIEKTIESFQDEVPSVIQISGEIYNMLKEIESLRKDPALMTSLGKIKEEIKKIKVAIRELDSFIKAARALHLSARAVTAVLAALEVTEMSAKAAKAARLSSQATKAASLTSQATKAARLSSQAAKAGKISSQFTKAARMTAAASGVLSVVGVALDVFSIVQDSIELTEMNQPEAKRKPEDIKSETLKFIHESRETVARLQKIVKTIFDSKTEISSVILTLEISAKLRVEKPGPV